ncbi:MAG: VWA domain-containing protein [Gammaproteobacteria bacterium]|nr:VWA domain-containing protein [Gammaproteobacteria bacterium]MDE0227111.1 VWA domain-containing protein [Gammaproteobacteria bacterium]MDE0453651.1 VWA domain-containing protein [Gammaproteobacteria bacterium]
MRHFATRFRYSRWDGTQALDIAADDVLAAIADDLTEYGDLRWALRNLMSRGMQTGGRRVQGLRDIMRKLRDRRRERLEQFDLSSVMRDIEQQLSRILEAEQDTIDEWMDREDDEYADQVLKEIADRNQEALDDLPDDVGGKMKSLEEYEFLNPDAQRKFLELLNQLRKAMTRTFFNDIERMVNRMSGEDIERMKDMVKGLNEMLERKIADEDPRFDDFMQEFGDMFGDDPPGSLDELLDQMRRQMAAAQSLLASLSPQQREQLQSLMSDRFGDPELEAELAKLANEMDFLNPEGKRYVFGGGDELDLEAAMRLMGEMRDLDQLIDQVREAERSGDLERIDEEALGTLLDDEATESLDNLKELLRSLRDAGYIRDGDRWELTPRGARTIGQKALGEIYARLRRQRLGSHALPEEGRFGDRLEQTKPYEYGDPFHLHMPRTIRNAIDREGPSMPVRLQPEDFEVYRSELRTSTATAMLVDQSWSMALRGAFQAAKKVALALHNLITSQYPRDDFYIIGFAAYARELKAHDLPLLQWDEYVLGTNMQHAMLLAEGLLSKHDAGSKQIIMISDGEPTAHLLPNGRHYFSYPPTRETYRATYGAVRRCTRKGIAINTFMLDSSYYLKEFMDQIARINGGRVFYTTPERLGEYVLVDYVEGKRRKLGRR